MNYSTFLDSKQIRVQTKGKELTGEIHPLLFPFQHDVVRWAVRKGRAAVFLDTGLGKTFIQLEWARLMGETTLIIAPLSVARQTVREAEKIGLSVRYVRSQDEIDGTGSLWITNYEMVGKFDFSQFGAVVLDESSILKSLAGKTRRKLIGLCRDVPYRLCCTATPAPNDHTEIGNHAEFLGVCKRSEMLAMFFVNANKEHTYRIGGISYHRKGTNKGGTEWRLKHHAETAFFRWLASWAITMIKPSDLGYDDDGFILPPLNIEPVFVPVQHAGDGELFFTGLHGVGHRAEMRQLSLDARLVELKRIVGFANTQVVPSGSNLSGEQWVIWCGLNAEQDAVAKAFEDECVSIHGSLATDEKLRRLELWLSGGKRILVSKPRVLGFGMNFQCAHKMAFFGLSDSWEMFYQCVRREWRYRQEEPVDVHIIMSSLEDAVYHNVMRKDAQARRLREKLIEQIGEYEKGELGMEESQRDDYQTDVESGDGWTAMLGDSCDRLGELDSDSIDLSVYSPPFADLYTYTDTERDLGNSRDWGEFFDHYAFIIREVLRVTKPGRLTCVHTSDIPAMQQKDGYIGCRDFPGAVIQAYEREGWVFHGRAFVQKNPQAQAIRVKSKALLFVQLRKDSASSRPALIDQILIFRKPGENAVPITPVENGEMDNEVWIEWAHGIWIGISETDTLQFYRARAGEDEKHICPLQLGTIERCIKLYSNPGETVLTPFGGIGSEGYMAVKLGRKAILIELKPSYFDTLTRNMRDAAAQARTPDLFTMAGIDVPDGKMRGLEVMTA